MNTIPEDFKELEKKYSFKQREETAISLFERDKWTYCPVSKSWRKYVDGEDWEFGGEEQIAFIKEPHLDGEGLVDWWYRIYVMCKDYFVEKNVFYHEPVLPMLEKAELALLLASAVRCEDLESVIYSNQRFSKIEFK